MEGVEILKPRTDKREYRTIVLHNSLQVLLISDPDTDKVSLCPNSFTSFDSNYILFFLIWLRRTFFCSCFSVLLQWMSVLVLLAILKVSKASLIFSVSILFLFFVLLWRKFCWRILFYQWWLICKLIWLSGCFFLASECWTWMLNAECNLSLENAFNFVWIDVIL